MRGASADGSNNPVTAMREAPDSESRVTQGPVFRPFDPDAGVRVYVRNLPHWRQPGATYFVTFRQDDSIPAPVLAEWLDKRARWYRAHKLDPRLKDTAPDRFADAYHRIPHGVRRAFEREQARMLHEELDRGHGSCVLRNAEPRKHVRESLGFFHGQRLWTGDWVVMPNHVHALVIPWDGSELEDLLASIKKWTSRLIGRWLGHQPTARQPAGPLHKKERFWQHESYDRIVRDAEELTAYRRYIARNAEAAGLPAGQYDYYAAPWLDAFALRS